MMWYKNIANYYKEYYLLFAKNIGDKWYSSNFLLSDFRVWNSFNNYLVIPVLDWDLQ